MLTRPIGRYFTSFRTKAIAAIDPFELDKLEFGYQKLQKSNSKSLLKKHLTRQVFNKIKTYKTHFGSTLLDCIQSGLSNYDCKIGVYAADAEAYTTFADLFNPIIENYHLGFHSTAKHPSKKWGNTYDLINLDPKKNYILLTKIQCNRSIEDYPFNPLLSEYLYKEIQNDVSSALGSLRGPLKGTFYPLAGLNEKIQQILMQNNVLFSQGSKLLKSAKAYQFWPTGRGIFYNEKRNFLVWCNELDHLRIISLEHNGNIGNVYRQLVDGIESLEKYIKFNHHDRLGYLTFCPTNLGSICTTVHIKLPRLSKNKHKLDVIAKMYNLHVCKLKDAENILYELSNKRLIGVTEYDSVIDMQKCITEILDYEEYC